jgi:hypothetical protein
MAGVFALMAGIFALIAGIFFFCYFSSFLGNDLSKDAKASPSYLCFGYLRSSGIGILIGI